MNYYIYDKTFEGLLTVVFDVYYTKKIPDKIDEKEEKSLFPGTTYVVETNENKARRVWKGLHKKLSKSACAMLPIVFFSELPDIEMLLFRYMQKALDSKKCIETNFGDTDVLQITKIYRKVIREAERLQMFVRFQKTADGIFFSPVEPIYNVIPIVVDFFEDRFADQSWIIYDVKRRYGMYYDLQKTKEVIFDNLDFNFETGKLNEAQAAKDELLFQQLWKNYFKTISIKERTNPKLHRQHLPMRFWKFLPEKQTQ